MLAMTVWPFHWIVLKIYIFKGRNSHFESRLGWSPLKYVPFPTSRTEHLVFRASGLFKSPYTTLSFNVL